MEAAVASAPLALLGTGGSVHVTDAAVLETARCVVERVVAGIDEACSRFRPDSELSRVNAAGGRPVAVSPRFVEAMAVALRAAQLTAGDVDPTVGGALRLLGYDRDFADLRPERDTPVAVRVPGWRLVELDEGACTVRVPAGVELDLGATAKALAADRAAAAAAAQCRAGVMVSLGGDIAISGAPPREGWRVLVTDDHAAGPHAPGQTVIIRSGGLATSSTAVRRWQRGGQTLHHIVAPRTGLPAQAVWRTVTVAAATCVDANIATTAAVVRGAAAPAWLSGLDLPARLVAPDGAVVTCAGWPPEAP